jgi:phosphoribosylamine--glycine ligase
VKVVVVGAGGREHALADVLSRTAEVVVTPGNAGIPNSVETPPEQLDADLFVIGPEEPLVAGLGDLLRAKGKRVFGPGADGARLEGSKSWMKEVLVDAGVPTARYGSFGAGQLDEALAFLETLPGLYVVKTDGLAAGKGVRVTESLDEARDTVREYLSGRAFGHAGTTCVIEEGLTGPELSVFAACDGTRCALFGTAQDFKRVGDGDQGPNTGGMGAYSPVPIVGPELLDAVVESAIEPTLAALEARGIEYRGFLYGGLMLTPVGPKVIEYNIRFGDPEAQVVLPRIEGDLAELLAQAADGHLADEPKFSDDSCVVVALASEGYPASKRTGDVIEGLDEAAAVDGATIYCAGVGADEHGRLVTNGGRVLNVVGRGPDLTTARARAYEAAGHVSWPGVHYRHDIAEQAAAATVTDR